MNVYSIHDTKAERFTPPFLAPTDEEAKRCVFMAVRGNSGMLSQFPEDFTLFRVATWDECSGVIEPIESVAVGNVLVILSAFHKPVESEPVEKQDE